LDYPPNRLGITWFVTQVLPVLRRKVPGVQVRVVGPGAAHLDPAVARVVDTRGAVEDLSEHYIWARACIAPLFTGSGTRVKIIEAMTYGRPVVATSLGAEGIDGRVGHDLLVGNDVESFAAACLTLLNPDGPAESIAGNGRRLADSCYSPTAFGEAVSRVVSVARERRDARVHRG
jgi:glycosyltransferase involved in cell wall biosynthesis